MCHARTLGSAETTKLPSAMHNTKIETAVEKVEILKNAGVTIAERPSDLGVTMAAVLNERELRTGT